MSQTFSICCVIDRHPRFYVELVLWAVCVTRNLPDTQFRPVVYFVGEPPADLSSWLAARGVEIRIQGQTVAGSPHCNKIHPFTDRHDGDVVIVTDADMYAVSSPADLLRSDRFRAPPNNHNNPPPRVYRDVLAAAGRGWEYRPGMAVFPKKGLRETHMNNICASFVACPAERSEVFSGAWLTWARWLSENRAPLGNYAKHVDQVSFGLAMEDLGEDVEYLSPHINGFLELLEQIETVHVFHLTTGHIPRFPHRFRADRTLDAAGLRPGVAQAIDRLNVCIKEAMDAIRRLPSTREAADMFLNPAWDRGA